MGNNFAIKIMDKAHITKNGKVKYVMMEKTLLSRLAHPHIVKLWFSFQACQHCLRCRTYVAIESRLLPALRRTATTFTW